jgi:hypothetical protein
MKVEYQTYKGFGITLIANVYRANAYANPSFQSKNLSKIKKAINQYLRDEKYTGYNEIYHIK